VIAEDRIEIAGAGIDAVTDHVIVTVITLLCLALVTKNAQHHWANNISTLNWLSSIL